MGTKINLNYGYDPDKPYTTSVNVMDDFEFGVFGVAWEDVAAYAAGLAYGDTAAEMFAKTWAYLLTRAVLGEAVEIFSVTFRSWSIIAGDVVWGASYTVADAQPPTNSESPQQRAIPNAVGGFYGVSRGGGGIVQYTVGLTSNNCAVTANGAPLNLTAPISITTVQGSLSRLLLLFDAARPVAFSTFNQVGVAAETVDLRPEYRAGVRRS